MINKVRMLTKKVKYILGIALIILALGLVAGGKLFWEKTKLEKSPASKSSEIVGTIISLGEENEFSLEKDGEIIFQNKAGDEPKIQYRISSPGKVVTGHWRDLELRDNVILIIYYDPDGQIESRILRIYRTEERAIEQ